MELEFYGQIFENYSNVQFHENQFSGSRVVQCGQTDGRTDRHDEANSRLPQFCERASKLLSGVWLCAMMYTEDMYLYLDVHRRYVLVPWSTQTVYVCTLMYTEGICLYLDVYRRFVLVPWCTRTVYACTLMYSDGIGLYLDVHRRYVLVPWCTQKVYACTLM